MFQRYFYIHFLLLLTCISQAQSGRNVFDLGTPVRQISRSLYNEFQVMDSRIDPELMGIVYIGTFNKKAYVTTLFPPDQQLKYFITHLIDSTAQHGEMLFQLRQLHFAEKINLSGNFGYCHIHIASYEKQDSFYFRSMELDTVLRIQGGDVTHEMYRACGMFIYQFLFASLRIPPHRTDTLSFQDIVMIDSLEKTTMPLYLNEEKPEGFYKTYESFKNLKPDGPVVIDFEFGKRIFNTVNAKGKSRRVYQNQVYAVVCQDTAYAATSFGFYPLEKRGSDFVFTGLTRNAPDAGMQMAMQALFGLMGALMVHGETEMIEYRLNHLDGAHIPLYRKRDDWNADE